MTSLTVVEPGPDGLRIDGRESLDVCVALMAAIGAGNDGLCGEEGRKDGCRRNSGNESDEDAAYFLISHLNASFEPRCLGRFSGLQGQSRLQLFRNQPAERFSLFKKPENVGQVFLPFARTPRFVESRPELPLKNVLDARDRHDIAEDVSAADSGKKSLITRIGLNLDS